MQSGIERMNTQARYRPDPYRPGPRDRTLSAAQHDRRGNGIQEHTYPPNFHREPTGIDGPSRWVLGASGAALVWYGLRQESALRWPLALIGAGLLYQGVSGNNMFDQMPMIAHVPIAKHLTSEPAQLRIRKTLTVNRPVEALYTYWRRLENLPTFMRHVESVQDLGEGRSHWVVNVLRDTQLEWDAQITVDRPNEMIAWETLPQARIQNRGYVKFIPTAHGTEVSVSIEYDPPGSVVGRLAGGAVKFIAAEQVKADIYNFKRIMEAGRLPTTEGQPAARPEAWHQHELRYGS